MRPSFKRAAATDFVIDFFLLEKKRLSFQRAKEQFPVAAEKHSFPFLNTGAPQRGHTPTASCAVPLEEGNRSAKTFFRGSMFFYQRPAHICNLIHKRCCRQFAIVPLVSAWIPILQLRLGDLILSGRTAIRFFPFP